eukprot:scaffold83411_cov26-Tisochrysis_lutea.AAC.1
MVLSHQAIDSLGSIALATLCKGLNRRCAPPCAVCALNLPTGHFSGTSRSLFRFSEGSLELLGLETQLLRHGSSS